VTPSDLTSREMGSDDPGSAEVRYRSLYLKAAVASKIERSKLHLGESQRVVISFPVIPFDSETVLRRMRASLVSAVQVRVVTGLVPPSTFVRHWT